MVRARTTTPKRRRSREWLGILAVLALAAVCGLVAAHFGTRRSWETPSVKTSTSLSVPADIRLGNRSVRQPRKDSVTEAERTANVVSLSSTDRARIAAHAADDKKAEDILVLDVAEIMGIVDAFVIAHASNPRLVRAIVDEVKEQLQVLAGVKPRSIEGLDDLSWVLLDYGDLIVHIFLAETREFYGLERLWTDAPRITWKGAAAI